MQAEEGIARVERAGADAEHRELLLTLVLARSDSAVLDAIEGDLSRRDDPVPRQIFAAERRTRRKGEVSAGRRALADRLLAMESPAEPELRAILDEASFEEIPRALCAPWLRYHARRLARERASPALAQIASAGELRLDPSVLSALDGWFASRLKDPGAPPPPELLARPPSEWVALLGDALTRVQSAALRKLGRSLAEIEDPTLAVALICAADRVADYRVRHNLCAGVSRSPFVPPLIVLLWDEQAMNVSLSPKEPHTALAAFLCAELWRAPVSAPKHDPIWKRLAELGEPVALAERIRFGGIDPSTGLSGYFGLDSMPAHPRAAEALLRIVLRRDERLEALQSRTRDEWDDSLDAIGIWRRAADLLPEVLAARPPPPSARRLLAELLRRDQASGAERDDLYRLALALGRIGEAAGLYVLLEQLGRSEPPSRELVRALCALGAAARDAIGALRARAGEGYAIIALAALEPEQAEWTERLLGIIADPSMKQLIETRVEYYHEGLITKGELDASLGLFFEAAQILRARDAPALWRASAPLAPLLASHQATLPELCALIRP